MSTMAMPQPTASEAAVRYLITNYSPKGNKVGWLMMASILVEAWDLYSIAFVLIFIKEQYNPTALMLGLAAAGTQGGALIGALLGGWLSDKIGRRVCSWPRWCCSSCWRWRRAFVPDITWLIVIRFLLGIPLGSDISTGYTYIMESMAKGEREVMGNRWHSCSRSARSSHRRHRDLPPDRHESRAAVAGDTRPRRGAALIILICGTTCRRRRFWLVQKGRYREAKQVAREMFNDNLDMLPDRDVEVPKVSTRAFLADLRKDPIRWRATIYGWIACFVQAASSRPSRSICRSSSSWSACRACSASIW